MDTKTLLFFLMLQGQEPYCRTQLVTVIGTLGELAGASGIVGGRQCYLGL